MHRLPLGDGNAAVTPFLLPVHLPIIQAKGLREPSPVTSETDTKHESLGGGKGTKESGFKPLSPELT